MPPTGPHLAMAALCERVITESDGVLSIIRIVDRMTQTATGQEPPEVMPPFGANVNMVVSLKADKAQGRYSLKFFMNSPNPTDERAQIGEQDINLKPGNSGVNLVVGMNLMLSSEGVYWIDVVFGGPYGQADELLTRIPLEVVYQRQRVPERPDPAG